MVNNIKLVIVGLAVVGLLVAGLAQAADIATVTATVTVQNISVQVSDGTVTYGTLGQNATADTEPADGQTVTNDGNVTENFNIRGQHSANWTLAATAGSNQYIHRFCNDTVNDCTTPPASYTALTTNYQTLATGINASGSVLFQLQINTPNPSTFFTQQSVDVMVQAIAS